MHMPSDPSILYHTALLIAIETVLHGGFNKDIIKVIHYVEQYWKQSGIQQRFKM
jgi:hypothetical protein